MSKFHFDVQIMTPEGSEQTIKKETVWKTLHKEYPKLFITIEYGTGTTAKDTVNAARNTVNSKLA